MTQTWQASLELRVEARAHCSVLAHSSHHGAPASSARLLSKRTAVCHVASFIHRAIVSGDQLDFDVGVGVGPRALVTTPSATKIYRSDGRRAAQRTRLSVARGAALEWLPQETIIFDGARVDLQTTVSLDEGAVFIGWDVQCLGRPAIAERFTSGECESGLEISRAGRLLFLERALYAGGSDVLAGGYGLAGHSAFGTMVAVAPIALELVRSILPPMSRERASLCDETRYRWRFLLPIPRPEREPRPRALLPSLVGASPAPSRSSGHPSTDLVDLTMPEVCSDKEI